MMSAEIEQMTPAEIEQMTLAEIDDLKKFSATELLKLVDDYENVSVANSKPSDYQNALLCLKACREKQGKEATKAKERYEYMKRFGKESDEIEKNGKKEISFEFDEIKPLEAVLINQHLIKNNALTSVKLNGAMIYDSAAGMIASCLKIKKDNLTELNLQFDNISDRAIASFAKALEDNKILKKAKKVSSEKPQEPQESQPVRLPPILPFSLTSMLYSPAVNPFLVKKDSLPPLNLVAVPADQSATQMTNTKKPSR